jgi:ParB family transcriptional regulator, chromosome partitioning protein
VPRHLIHADALARAVDLNMAAAGWFPTVDNYLGRVPKARILQAVREAKDDASAQLIDHLKKSEMAKEAERLLASTGWLPEAPQTTDAQRSLRSVARGRRRLSARASRRWPRRHRRSNAI